MVFNANVNARAEDFEFEILAEYVYERTSAKEEDWVPNCDQDLLLVSWL